VHGVTADTLLGLPVRLHGIQLGRPVDLVLEPVTLRVVGVHVRCGDGSDRFVPLPAVHVTDEEIEVRSALMLLDEENLSFYRSRGRTLSALRGSPVARGRQRLGELVDLVLAADGNVSELVVAHDGTRKRVRLGDGVGLVERGRMSAA
jgi:hypothetical protein